MSDVAFAVAALPGLRACSLTTTAALCLLVPLLCFSVFSTPSPSYPFCGVELLSVLPVNDRQLALLDYS